MGETGRERRSGVIEVTGGHSLSHAPKKQEQHSHPRPYAVHSQTNEG